MYKTLSFEQGSINSDYKYWGVEIPVYVMTQMKMNKGNRFYVGVGPYAEYGLCAKHNTGGNEIDLYEKEEALGKASMTRFTIGAAAIIGFEFSCGIQANVGYKTGLTDSLEANENNASMFPNTVSFGIGYRF